MSEGGSKRPQPRTERRGGEPLAERRYTLMIVPERGGGAVRQVSVTLAQARRWAGLLGLAVTAVVLSVLLLSRSGPSRDATERLVEENLSLKGRLRAIEATLEEVDTELERLRVYDAQLQGLPEKAIEEGALLDDADQGQGPFSRAELKLAGLLGDDDDSGSPGALVGEGDPMHALDGDELGDDAMAWAELVEERAQGVLGRVRFAEARLGVVAESAEYWRTRQAAMPTQNPCPDCDLSSGFGYRRSPFTKRWKFHSGLDLRAERGTPIVAAAPGTVLRSEWNEGYGRMIEIDHGYEVTTRYAHNARVFVRAGDVVDRGDIIATIGMTGRTTGPHLHFEVRIDGTPVDPQEFLE